MPNVRKNNPKETVMSKKSFFITDHALSRMESRQISRLTLAKIIFTGQVFSRGNGRFIAKLKQRVGNSIISYSAVFSKKNGVIYTVWSSIKPYKKYVDEEKQKAHKKFYKQRKRMIADNDFNTYCREEFSEYSIRRCA